MPPAVINSDLYHCGKSTIVIYICQENGTVYVYIINMMHSDS